MDPFWLILVCLSFGLMILGVIQLINRKVTGKNIGDYTEQSIRKFALIRGIIYLVGGALILCTCFALRNPGGTGASLIIIAIALPIALKSSVLKKK